MEAETSGQRRVWNWIAERATITRLQEEVKKGLSWLTVETDGRSQAQTRLNNLALSHKHNLDEGGDGGTWREVAEQLRDLAATADQMAAQVKQIRHGALLVLLKETCMDQDELRERADLRGLISELRKIPFDDLVFSVHDPSDEAVEPPPTAPLEIRMAGDFDICEQLEPRWIDRPEALALVCREGAKIASKKAEGRGRRRAVEGFHGSPQLQLLRECAVQLRELGQDDAKAYELARIVHHLVSGEPPTKDWGREAKRQFDPWWIRVRAWWGREPEAPEEIRMLMKGGPQALPKRRAKPKG